MFHVSHFDRVRLSAKAFHALVSGAPNTVHVNIRTADDSPMGWASISIADARELAAQLLVAADACDSVSHQERAAA